ncbi:hypothetical protein ACGFI9_19670 [Micromonospora sp. NPDC048930]|uniref:hypothetical protein n=1 Tax=Micromonospora sp. NPDC048930 TaxID=3364261 RepID=UPI00371AE4E8
MFALFRRRNAGRHSYRRSGPTSTATAPSYRKVSPPPPDAAPGPPRPNAAPTWATHPTVAFPRPGRAGWLTPAQAWRANGGHW